MFDFSEFLVRSEYADRLRAALGDSTEFDAPVAFDDPCHLCHGQGVRSEPRELLDLIPNVKRVEIEDSESCCGSAGIYSLIRPAASQGILAPRLDAVLRSGTRTLVTANPGCQLQWQAGFKERGESLEIVHIAELLSRAVSSKS